MTAVLRDLFEPNPQLLHPEPWRLYERMGRELLDAWDRVCKERLAAGDAEPLQAVRDEYLAVLLAHMKIIDGYLSLLDREDNPRATAHADQVRATRELLQQHHDKLFPRWQTLDDLECILLAPLALSKAQRDMLVAHYPPPQSWFEETIDPFEPEATP